MANREYKSDVFSMLLEDKCHALELYNAMAGTDYIDPDIVEICTLEKGVSLTIKNDASFIVNMDETLNIYEHQSTYNPNIPLRELIYFVTIIKDMVEDRYIYSRRLVKIPTPRFAVFYNGEENRPEQEVLKLSSAFKNQSVQPQLELMCTVYNISPGNNVQLMQTCHTLKDYTTFVEHVKDKLIEYGKTRDGYAQAVSDAIDHCIEENILKEFFLNRREEVQKAMIFDFTYEKQMENAKKEWYQDGKEEGRVEGREEGREEGLEQGDKRRLVSQIVKKLGKNKSYDQIVDELEIEDTDIRKLYEIIVKHAPEYDMDVILQEYRQLEV